MAKTIGPLHSNTASGTFGPRMVFSKRASGQQVRFQKAQKDKFSLPQITNRGLYNIAVITWNNLTQTQKDNYILLAKKENITGYNYFMREAILNPKLYLGLVGYWPMNETTGAIVYDKSGNGNHGTLKPTYPTDCPTRIPSFNKKTGNALDFNVKTWYVDCGLASICNFTSEDFSISFLYKYTYILNRLPLCRGMQVKHGWYINSVQQNGISFYTQKLSLQRVTHSKINALPDNKWCHLVFVRVGTLITIYINGVNQTASHGVHLDPDSSPFHLLIFNYNTPLYCPLGSINELSIFNRQLSINEIKALYKKYF